ncbi:MAG: hypothetical protein Q7L55_00265 [Actinomycetota bacterium]|nr:hypothetical protein [Actinomycetota bacterium]
MTEIAPARGPLAPILISAIWPVAFVLGAWPAIATVFLFDSGPDLELWGWFIFYGMWGFEALALLVIPVAWVVWALTRHKSWGGKLLIAIALFPLLALVPVVAAFFLDNA